MSEEQERKERWKAIKGLRARLKRWWEILLTSFEILIGFFIILGVATLIWFNVGPEYAKFVTYVFGGFLVFFQIMASARRATAAEKTAEAMQETVQLTETGNIAERFKNAIEHLGHKSVSVRLGGIYALHNIAQNVPEYRERVFEILCAHIRETTQEAYETRVIEFDLKAPTIEIQSILDLLFVKTPGREIYEGLKANLEKAYLKEAQLGEAYLKNANFSHAILYGAGLSEADLQGANFSDATLDDANLSKADLQEANLSMASFQKAGLDCSDLRRAKLSVTDLQGANLRKAYLQKTIVQTSNLQNADLQGADLQGADLQGADLQGADLQGADLQGADLQGADLQGADLRETDLVGAKNLKVEQLLKAKTLYKAKLPEGTEDIIRKQNLTLFKEPSDEDDA